MKTIERKYYVCEICGKTSRDAEKIEACQKSHMTIGNDALLECNYNKGSAYPDTIKFTLSDKVELSYCLTAIRADSSK